MRLNKITVIVDDYGIIHQVFVEKDNNCHLIPVSRVENYTRYPELIQSLMFILDLRKQQDNNNNSTLFN